MTNRIWKPSVTVAAMIEREGNFLLVEEEIDGRIVFNQPAGHWEPGETLMEACAREAMEETAHLFEPTEVLGLCTWRKPDSNSTYVRVAFTGKVGVQDPARKLDKNIRRAVWLTLDEVRQLKAQHRSPLVMACIEKYLSGVRYPLALIAHF